MDNGGIGGDIAAEPSTAGSDPGIQLTACPTDNLTRPCKCQIDDGGEANGTQVCSTSTGWGRCQCYEVPETMIQSDDTLAPDPQENKGPGRFDWFRTMAVGGECKAGHYKGEFSGRYSPSITFTIGVFDITGTVEFDLYESGNGEYLEIKDGVMEGWAVDFVPFMGEIIGKLDCATGKVDAYLVNCVYVFAVVLPAAFEGPAFGVYDKLNHAFVNGVWSVTERDIEGNYADPLPVSPGEPLPAVNMSSLCGGVGSWSATFDH